jgi:hypothetical protein
MSQDVAFVALAWRDGWATEFEIQRNGCSHAAMAALLEGSPTLQLSTSQVHSAASSLSWPPNRVT